MPKQWMCEIKIEIDQFGVEAETKEEFIQKTKELFLEEYNLALKDHEIKNIQEIIDVYGHNVKLKEGESLEDALVREYRESKGD